MDCVEKGTFLIMVCVGLFLILAGSGIMVFGKPMTMSFGGPFTSPDREPTMIRLDFYLELGWRIVIIGFVALGTCVIFFIDSIGSNLASNT